MLDRLTSAVADGTNAEIFGTFPNRVWHRFTGAEPERRLAVI